MRKLLILLIIGLVMVPNAFAVWNIFSPETPPPLIIRWIFGEPWFQTDGTNITFNETHLNLFIAGSINNTHIEGTEPWLYDDFDNMYFNETHLNGTIDNRVSSLGIINSEKTGGGIYLYNDSTTIYVNGTLLNQTIRALDTLNNLSCGDNQIAKWNNGNMEWECANDNFEADTDTHAQGDGIYLYNDSTTMYFNETKLNESINQSVIDNSLWYQNGPEHLSPQAAKNVNMSDGNITDVDTIFVHNISGRSPVGILNGSGHYMAIFTDTSHPQYGDSFGDLRLRTLTVDRLLITGLLNYSFNEPPDNYDADEIWITENNFTFYFNGTLLQQEVVGVLSNYTKGTVGPYLYNDTTLIYFNSTLLNETITALNTDTDTHVEGVGPYLYNDSKYIYFNGTLMNDTISYIISALNITNGTDGINGINGTDGANLTFNSIINLGNGSYLWNFSDGTIYITGNLNGINGINGTDGINGINGTDGINGINGTDGINGTTFNVSGPYLYNNGSNVIFFNATALPPDTQKQGDGIFLTNDSITIYFNSTLLNQTINSMDRFWLLLWPWLTNNSGYIQFNETKLNETIDARDTDTQKQGAGYLYNDSTTIYLNGTLLNETINALADDTQKNASGLYLYNDSTTIYYNESKLNETIIFLSDIKAYELQFNVTVAGGTGTYATTQSINYLITQITVTPPSTPAVYRFEALEGSDGDYIDQNRIPHLNTWDIYKTHSINDTINVTISSATVNGQYTVRIKYIDNVIQV